jgi:hypothetical protein
MLNIKTFLTAVAVSLFVAFTMPSPIQATPFSAPVKVQNGKDRYLVQVSQKKKWKKKNWNKKNKNKWRESRKYRNRYRLARYCDPWDGCYRRRHVRYYPYWEPYYGYPYGGYGYPYAAYGYGGYGYPYGGYGPGFFGPAIGLYFRIH